MFRKNYREVRFSSKMERLNDAVYFISYLCHQNQWQAE